MVLLSKRVVVQVEVGRKLLGSQVRAVTVSSTADTALWLR